MGISKRSVERRLHKLEAAGFIKRRVAQLKQDSDQLRREYDLTGFVQRLHECLPDSFQAGNGTK